jgi:hypothetical protein
MVRKETKTVPGLLMETTVTRMEFQSHVDQLVVFVLMEMITIIIIIMMMITMVMLMMTIISFNE